MIRYLISMKNDQWKDFNDTSLLDLRIPTIFPYQTHSPMSDTRSLFPIYWVLRNAIHDYNIKLQLCLYLSTSLIVHDFLESAGTIATAQSCRG